MFKDIEAQKARHEELQRLISDPAVISNSRLYQRYAKEFADLSRLVNKYNEYQKLQVEIKEAEHVLSDKSHDESFLDLARQELESLTARKAAMEAELEDAFLSGQDPLKNRDIIMEIRAGTGGLEASLFASELFRMYSKYAQKMGWQIEVMSANTTEKGGFKEVIFSISGDGVYGRMKFESGTHRVQRVPETEASGRIHTSAATVAVLPEVEDVDVEIKPEDLRIDTFRAGGAGGQHVNKTESAIRITHIPTGFVVSCQDERSQHKNKEKALRVMRARLYDMMRAEQEKKISKDRKAQVGSGDRSEKIRTYNFPDGRVTDHRIGLTLYNIADIMEGEMDELIDALRSEERKLQ
ncbi:MAG: peptide chain release factor 1, partial [Candidatus Omnitrophica bacterium]|nr:peptide chain release factor 1 [Candidatus Omnitrophota bacterium]